jgi:acetyl-CoA synthetase
MAPVRAPAPEARPPDRGPARPARPPFSWDRARAELDGLPGGRGLNIAHECVDRHAEGPRAAKPALRFVSRAGSTTEWTYAGLRAATNRFANVLEELGVDAGERVFVLTGRRPELYVAVLGTLKRRAVACTLFSAFGPEPIRQRMELGDARMLVTTAAIYRRKVAAWRETMPSLAHVLLVGARRT